MVHSATPLAQAQSAPNYSTDAIRAHCELLALPVDEEGLGMAAMLAQAQGLTQAQFDAALMLHANRMKFLFSPKSYDWRTRLALAWHFLFNPKGW